MAGIATDSTREVFVFLEVGCLPAMALNAGVMCLRTERHWQDCQS
jgi:hypothetical protein